jgi:hypothetical protein
VAERHAIHGSRHLDVGENRSDIRPVFEYIDSFGRTARFDGAKSGIFQAGHNVHTHEDFVFDDENKWSHLLASVGIGLQAAEETSATAYTSPKRNPKAALMQRDNRSESWLFPMNLPAGRLFSRIWCRKVALADRDAA